MMSNEKDHSPEATEMALRQLALVDRIIGLEAQLAQLRVSYAHDEVAAVKASMTWRAGRFVLAPLRAVRRLARR